ncbi:MAG: hypothetical protein KDI72_14905, partial [Xanthomonadales bacterium]|nr:hypothetical protein [Xanthomonadales bacterium]
SVCATRMSLHCGFAYPLGVHGGGSDRHHAVDPALSGQPIDAKRAHRAIAKRFPHLARRESACDFFLLKASLPPPCWHGRS